MFQFPGFPSYTYVFSIWYMVLLHGGFPIRKSTDIMLICSSPWLIAACHVLLRLLMPRHSPCALISLNFFKTVNCFSCSLKNRLSFANNCYGCCYYCFATVWQNCSFLLTFFGKTNVIFINLLLNYLFVLLSYSVVNEHFAIFDSLVGTSGLEPPTSRLSAECSSQLS